MIISERLMKSNTRQDFIFLYLIKIIREIAKKAANPARRIYLINPAPRVGEIVSSFTIYNL